MHCGGNTPQGRRLEAETAPAVPGYNLERAAKLPGQEALTERRA